MSNKQAVNDTNAESSTPAEEVVAQEDNLDTLLSEFDSKTKKDEVDTTGSDTKEPTGLSKEDRELLEEVRADKFSKELNTEIDSIKSHLSDEVNISGKLLKQIVVGMADENRDIASAYTNRRSNPEGWAKVQKAIASEIGKEFLNQPDQAATDNHEAVAAAVRSASTTTPPEDKPLTNEDMNKMSDAEFQRLEVSMK